MNVEFISPSQQDGIEAAAEAVQLAYAADLIRESAAALRLSQPACVTAQLLLHRFYTRVSLRAHSTVWSAGAALLLSAKLGDQPRSLRHVANVLHDRLATREGNADVICWRGKQRRRPLDFYGAAGYDWKHELIATERHLLKELGFRLLVELPHKFVLIFVNTLRDKCRAPAWTEPGVQEFRRLLQHAWNYANDVMRVRVCVAEEPEAIACACIALAVAHCRGELPMGWQLVFGSSPEQCARIAEQIKHMYRLPSTNGMLVDYSLCPVFLAYHTDWQRPGDKRQPFEDRLKDEVERAGTRKRNRFEDKLV